MKVAALQMNSGEVMDENLTVADRLIYQAAEFGAELVVLPENFSLMTGDHEVKLAAAQRGQEVRRFLSELAKNTAFRWWGVQFRWQAQKEKLRTVV